MHTQAAVFGEDSLYNFSTENKTAYIIPMSYILLYILNIFCLILYICLACLIDISSNCHGNNEFMCI